MIKKYIVLACVSLALLGTLSWANDNQILKDDINRGVSSHEIKECMTLKHGLMMECLRKGISALEKSKDLAVRESLSTQDSEEVSIKMNPVKKDEKSFLKGKEIYFMNCLPCHGQTGQGDGPASTGGLRRAFNLTDPSLNNFSDGELFQKITDGGWPMPAFGFRDDLSEEELWHVINYLRTLTVVE